jgi:hypothetical protein
MDGPWCTCARTSTGVPSLQHEPLAPLACIFPPFNVGVQTPRGRGGGGGGPRREVVHAEKPLVGEHTSRSTHGWLAGCTRTAIGLGCAQLQIACVGTLCGMGGQPGAPDRSRRLVLSGLAQHLPAPGPPPPPLTRPPPLPLSQASGVRCTAVLTVVLELRPLLTPVCRWLESAVLLNCNRVKSLTDSADVVKAALRTACDVRGMHYCSSPPRHLRKNQHPHVVGCGRNAGECVCALTPSLLLAASHQTPRPIRL